MMQKEYRTIRCGDLDSLTHEMGLLSADQWCPVGGLIVDQCLYIQMLERNTGEIKDGWTMARFRECESISARSYMESMRQSLEQIKYRYLNVNHGVLSRELDGLLKRADEAMQIWHRGNHESEWKKASEGKEGEL